MTMKIIGSLAFLVCALLVRETNGYGFDCSFPIFNETFSRDCGDLPDRSQVYKKYMEGCRAYYSEEDCEEEEESRILHNRLQPISSVVSFTA
jgi:hypothetical protein